MLGISLCVGHFCCLGEWHNFMHMQQFGLGVHLTALAPAPWNKTKQGNTGIFIKKSYCQHSLVTAAA